MPRAFLNVFYLLNLHPLLWGNIIKILLVSAQTSVQFSRILKLVPSNNFNAVLTFSLGLYDVATSDNVKSTLKQRFVHQHWIFQCLNGTTKQHCHIQGQFLQSWAAPKQRWEYDHLLKKQIKVNLEVRAKQYF